jgi:hypothetical protein
MRKIFVIVLIMLSIVLTACTSDQIRLPNLEGKVEHEIEIELNNLGLEFEFFQMNSVSFDRSKQFVSYGNFYEVGDRVDKDTFITVIISKTLIDQALYFEPVDLLYDGPLLDEDFFDFDLYVLEGSTYIGTGGAFFVEYNPALGLGRCIDGDTTVFDYPSDIVSKIESRASSTRYFNVDTPETYPGAESEWGKPATHYVCNLLLTAESIVLQTDPMDNLLDRHGRFLAWVWIKLPNEDEYFLLNYMIVRQGLGEVAYYQPPNYNAGSSLVTSYDGLTYTEWMLLGQMLAIEDELGMHGDKIDWYWDYENDEPIWSRWG